MIEAPATRLWNSSISELYQVLRRAVGLSAFDETAFSTSIISSVDQDRLNDIAYAIRGVNYRPAVFVHGVMPRAGTNFVADLLKLHQDIAPYPLRLMEFPLLRNASAVQAAQVEFLRTYKRNADILTRFELLAILASAMLRREQAVVGEERTVLLKVPHAEYLFLFHALFPRDHCVMVIRDGRDAVASHQSTFGRHPLKPHFTELAQKWAASTRSALDYSAERIASPGAYLSVFYEEANTDPEATLRTILDTCQLPAARCHFERANELPVRGSSVVRSDSGVDWQPLDKPTDFQPVGRWHHWGRRTRQRFKKVAGDALIRAGYETSNDW